MPVIIDNMDTSMRFSNQQPASSSQPAAYQIPPMVDPILDQINLRDSEVLLDTA